MTEEVTTQGRRPAVLPDDPYTLSPDDVQEPPTTWRGTLRKIGPGLIISAEIVGSGELIATTALGAQAGFALLWMILLSTFVKVALQIELARWTISTGQPAITGFNKVPPKIGKTGWITFLLVVLFLAKMLQFGGIIGGVATALSFLMPVGGDPLGFTSLCVWTTIVAVLSIALIYSNKYSLVERGAVFLVMIFTLMTVGIAVGLPFTPFAYTTEEFLSGFAFQIPLGALGIALAMFGLTGVGANEIMAYTYWCTEKGYARWSGPPDGSDAWVRRANGWIKVMYKDAYIAWGIYTLSTFSFFLMGAAVLHPQGLVPQGNEMISTLSRMYTDTLGAWSGTVFLIGAVAVLGSTLWAALPGFARIFTNILGAFGVLDWHDTAQRMRWVRIFTVALPIIWAVAYLFFTDPVAMIIVGGIANGIFLLAVVVAVWYLRRTEVDPRLYGGGLFNALLILSSVAISALAVYLVLEAVGITIG